MFFMCVKSNSMPVTFRTRMNSSSSPFFTCLSLISSVLPIPRTVWGRLCQSEYVAHLQFITLHFEVYGAMNQAVSEPYLHYLRNLNYIVKNVDKRPRENRLDGKFYDSSPKYGSIRTSEMGVSASISGQRCPFLLYPLSAFWAGSVLLADKDTRGNHPVAIHISVAEMVKSSR